MDPTANLKEQRQIAAQIERCSHEATRDDRPCGCVDRAQRLAELVEALDGWITRGGFVPAQWHKAAR